jgi:hypothetical protein
VPDLKEENTPASATTHTAACLATLQQRLKVPTSVSIYADLIRVRSAETTLPEKGVRCITEGQNTLLYLASCLALYFLFAFLILTTARLPPTFIGQQRRENNGEKRRKAARAQTHTLLYPHARDV